MSVVALAPVAGVAAVPDAAVAAVRASIVAMRLESSAVDALLRRTDVAMLERLAAARHTHSQKATIQGAILWRFLLGAVNIVDGVSASELPDGEKKQALIAIVHHLFHLRGWTRICRDADAWAAFARRYTSDSEFQTVVDGTPLWDNCLKLLGDDAALPLACLTAAKRYHDLAGGAEPSNVAEFYSMSKHHELLLNVTRVTPASVRQLAAVGVARPPLEVLAELQMPVQLRPIESEVLDCEAINMFGFDATLVVAGLIAGWPMPLATAKKGGYADTFPRWFAIVTTTATTPPTRCSAGLKVVRATQSALATAATQSLIGFIRARTLVPAGDATLTDNCFSIKGHWFMEFDAVCPVRPVPFIKGKSDQGIFAVDPGQKHRWVKLVIDGSGGESKESDANDDDAKDEPPAHVAQEPPAENAEALAAEPAGNVQKGSGKPAAGDRRRRVRVRLPNATDEKARPSMDEKDDPEADKPRLRPLLAAAKKKDPAAPKKKKGGAGSTKKPKAAAAATKRPAEATRRPQATSTPASTSAALPVTAHDEGDEVHVEQPLFMRAAPPLRIPVVRKPLGDPLSIGAGNDGHFEWALGAIARFPQNIVILERESLSHEDLVVAAATGWFRVSAPPAHRLRVVKAVGGIANEHVRGLTVESVARLYNRDLAATRLTHTLVDKDDRPEWVRGDDPVPWPSPVAGYTTDCVLSDTPDVRRHLTALVGEYVVDGGLLRCDKTRSPGVHSWTTYNNSTHLPLWQGDAKVTGLNARTYLAYADAVPPAAKFRRSHENHCHFESQRIGSVNITLLNTLRADQQLLRGGQWRDREAEELAGDPPSLVSAIAWQLLEDVGNYALAQAVYAEANPGKRWSPQSSVAAPPLQIEEFLRRGGRINMALLHEADILFTQGAHHFVNGPGKHGIAVNVLSSAIHRDCLVNNSLQEVAAYDPDLILLERYTAVSSDTWRPDGCVPRAFDCLRTMDRALREFPHLIDHAPAIDALQRLRDPGFELFAAERALAAHLRAHLKLVEKAKAGVGEIPPYTKFIRPSRDDDKAELALALKESGEVAVRYWSLLFGGKKRKPQLLADIIKRDEARIVVANLLRTAQPSTPADWKEVTATMIEEQRMAIWKWISECANPKVPEKKLQTPLVDGLALPHLATIGQVIRDFVASAAWGDTIRRPTGDITETDGVDRDAARTSGEEGKETKEKAKKKAQPRRAISTDEDGDGVNASPRGTAEVKKGGDARRSARNRSGTPWPAAGNDSKRDGLRSGSSSSSSAAENAGATAAESGSTEPVADPSPSSSPPPPWGGCASPSPLRPPSTSRSSPPSRSGSPLTSPPRASASPSPSPSASPSSRSAIVAGDGRGSPGSFAAANARVSKRKAPQQAIVVHDEQTATSSSASPSADGARKADVRNPPDKRARGDASETNVQVQEATSPTQPHSDSPEPISSAAAAAAAAATEAAPPSGTDALPA